MKPPSRKKEKKKKKKKRIEYQDSEKIKNKLPLTINEGLL